MTRIWITEWATHRREGGVIAVDLPDELVPAEDGRLFRIPREFLAPWKSRSFFLAYEVYDKWFRSEAQAREGLKRDLERRARRAQRELDEARQHLAALKKNGLPMAETLAERRARRRRRHCGDCDQDIVVSRAGWTCACGTTEPSDGK